MELGAKMIGTVPRPAADSSSAESEGAERLVLYDSERQQVIEELGSSEIYPDPGNDVALIARREMDGPGIRRGGTERLRGLSALRRRLGTHTVV